MLIFYRPFPARNIALFRSSYSEILSRYWKVNDGSCGNKDAGFKFNRRNQYTVRANENVVADCSCVLINTIVITKNCAGADINAGTDYSILKRYGRN